LEDLRDLEEDLDEDLDEDLEDLRLRPPTEAVVAEEPEVLNIELKESAAAVVAEAIVDICFIY
jgi:hypothetical protein